MATRATYTFVDLIRKLTTTAYIHYDGYDFGAAEYLDKMLTLSADKKYFGGYFEQFIRANPKAEIVKDPKDHIDTEYHYKIFEDPFNPPTIKAYAYKWNDPVLDGNDLRVEKLFFDGTLESFLNRFRKQNNEEI